MLTLVTRPKNSIMPGGPRLRVVGGQPTGFRYVLRIVSWPLVFAGHGSEEALGSNWSDATVSFASRVTTMN